MYYVYVLKSLTSGKLYKGFTSDLEKRIKVHNSSSGKRFTSKDQPWVLIYSEQFITRSEAVLREKFLKSGIGRDFIKQKLNG
jgi:putative endonuclease